MSSPRNVRRFTTITKRNSHLHPLRGGAVRAGGSEGGGHPALDAADGVVVPCAPAAGEGTMEALPPLRVHRLLWHTEHYKVQKHVGRFQNALQPPVKARLILLLRTWPAAFIEAHVQAGTTISLKAAQWLALQVMLIAL